MTIPDRPRSLQLTALCLLLAAQALHAAPPSAESPWTGFDETGYRLESGETGYLLVPPEGDAIAIPLEWLEPPGARQADSQSTVSSLQYVREVTAFPVGGGRIGLHIASYDIQDRGSLQAAVGRDVFLRLDPETRALTVAGPDLGVSRGRSRLGGCFQAWFHHISVGDVDCDRYLDLAVVEERISCEPDDDGLDQAVYARGPVVWYRQQQEGWIRDDDLEGHLPCAGFADLPLLAIGKTPVDFVLGFKRDASPLPHGDPQPFEER